MGIELFSVFGMGGQAGRMRVLTTYEHCCRHFVMRVERLRGLSFSPGTRLKT